MRPDSPDPSWSSWREAIGVILHRPFLARTSRIAIFVGVLLFLINHFDEIWRGDVPTSTWMKGLASCLVPFAVANWGILTATRRRE